MSDVMQFLETFEDFIRMYSFKDTEEIYTNGSMLLTVYRVMQAVEHYFPTTNETSKERDL